MDEPDSSHVAESEQPMIVTHDLQVCIVCLHLIATGEYNDGTDAGALCGQGLADRWADLARQMAPGEIGSCDCAPDEDHEASCLNLGHHTSPCDGCGDSAHGDRFAAVVLEPEQG